MTGPALAPSGIEHFRGDCPDVPKSQMKAACLGKWWMDWEIRWTRMTTSEVLVTVIRDVYQSRTLPRFTSIALDH